MLNLIKNTYLFDNRKIKFSIERLWKKYQLILNKKNISWEEANEARAILYFIGYLYPEKIALESLARRVSKINPKISLDKFLSAIDSDNKNLLNKYKNNINFNKLWEFYLIIKSIKNRVNRDNTYLDEETFNKIYNNIKPKNYF